MLNGYDGVKRLSKDNPEWLPIVKACLICAKEYHEFAGSWAYDEAKKLGVGWFPNLRKLASYGILKHTKTPRGGKRAYYIIPDIEGVERALKELEN